MADFYTGAADQDKGPDNPSSDYSAMLPYWEMVNSINGGAETIRAAGELYLPKMTNESSEDYRPLDLSTMESGTIKLFEGLTLPSLLMQFALLSRPEPVQKLRDQAFAAAKAGHISTMFGTVYSDPEGKIVAETEGAPAHGEPQRGLDKGHNLKKYGDQAGLSITLSSSTSSSKIGWSTEGAGDGPTASGIGEPLRKSAAILSFRSLNLSDIISSP